jgi:histidyl-tRNA synthetase
VLVMPGVEAIEASRAAHELRLAGLATELFVGAAVGKVGKQLAYANAQGFRAAVMIGSNELKDDTVTVKDLQAGLQARSGITENKDFRSAGKSGQHVVPRSDLVATVRSVIAGATNPEQTDAESEPNR